MSARKSKAGGRSVLAQKAQFRSSAGAMDGSKKLRVKRRRQEDRREEQRSRRNAEDA